MHRKFILINTFSNHDRHSRRHFVEFDVSNACTCDVTVVTSCVSAFLIGFIVSAPSRSRDRHTLAFIPLFPRLGHPLHKAQRISAAHVLNPSPFNPLKMPPPKRRFEAIDLTEEDSPIYSSQRASSSQGHAYAQWSQSSPNGRAPKQSRTTASSRTPSGASQNDPVYIDDDEEEDVSATQGFTEQEYSWILYGQMHAKIVGVRYYDGYATVGEMVVVRRDPSNPYDSKFL
jgi:hypothetical protein